MKKKSVIILVIISLMPVFLFSSFVALIYFTNKNKENSSYSKSYEYCNNVTEIKFESKYKLNDNTELEILSDFDIKKSFQSYEPLNYTGIDYLLYDCVIRPKEPIKINILQNDQIASSFIIDFMLTVNSLDENIVNLGDIINNLDFKSNQLIWDKNLIISNKNVIEIQNNELFFLIDRKKVEYIPNKYGGYENQLVIKQINDVDKNNFFNSNDIEKIVYVNNDVVLPIRNRYFSVSDSSTVIEFSQLFKSHDTFKFYKDEENFFIDLAIDRLPNYPKILKENIENYCIDFRCSSNTITIPLVIMNSELIIEPETMIKLNVKTLDL